MGDIAREVYEKHANGQKPAFMNSPTVDPAGGILRADTSLTDDRRAALWDIFHDAQTPTALAKILQSHELSSDTKHRLFEAKQRTAPASDSVETTAAALQRVAQIPASVLDIAEKYPTATKALTDAATSRTNTKKKSKA